MSAVRRYGDVGLAFLVVLIVGMMIIPLPTPLLDVLIAANISIGVLMLLVSMYVPDAISFASFPTVLLITTLYRLALNVSSTRLVLLQADAGEVIRAFGGFVVRGNYVVGAIVFLVLTLIQFLVIAKGSERVAEVGARFTLDAMPGKQMSIDADLRTGAISQEDARKKRKQIQREAQFYGAMDGAMKFVKGDAIAGIVITVVNIVGGLAIGVLQRDLSAVQALKTYGLLTIGDGLVSQIPALLISTAAGLVVTRVASEDEGTSLGAEIGGQIFGSPRAMGIASVFLVGLALVPGLPAAPFLVIAAALGLGAYRLARSRGTSAPEREALVVEKEVARETRARQAMVPIVVPVSIELGLGLADEAIDPKGGGPLLERELPLLRDALFADLGVALPGVRARPAPDLAARAYVLSMAEVPVGSGEIPEGKHLALASPTMLGTVTSGGAALTGTDALDPSDGTPAAWLDSASAAAAEAAGIVTLDASAVIARHLAAAVRRRAQDLVGLQEVQTMLEQLERAYPALVRHVVPKPVSLSLLADVLRRLVDEGVSIRPLREVLEALALHAPTEKDAVTLTELVRGALRRQITHRYARSGTLAVTLLDPSIEEAVREAIQRTNAGSYLALSPDVARDILGAVQREVPFEPGTEAVLLTQADVRRFVRRLVESERPELVVLSYQELAPEVVVQPLGRVAV
jgi:type III secretion protein V